MTQKNLLLSMIVIIVFSAAGACKLLGGCDKIRHMSTHQLGVLITGILRILASYVIFFLDNKCFFFFIKEGAGV